MLVYNAEAVTNGTPNWSRTNGTPNWSRCQVKTQKVSQSGEVERRLKLDKLKLKRASLKLRPKWHKRPSWMNISDKVIWNQKHRHNMKSFCHPLKCLLYIFFKYFYSQCVFLCRRLPYAKNVEKSWRWVHIYTCNELNMLLWNA